MKNIIVYICLLPLLLTFHVNADAVFYPHTVTPSLVSTAPYRDTGIVYSYPSTSSTSMTMGSGYLVNKRVAVTSAHVIFDKTNLAWNAHIGFNPGYNDALSKLSGNFFAGSIRINSYSKQVQLDTAAGYAAGNCSFEAFNLDIVAIYSLRDQASAYGSYAVRWRGISALASEGYKSLLLGYPVDTNVIASANIGKMFETGPGNWAMEDYFGDNTGQTLVYTGSATAFAALYLSFDTMNVYTGNSGGPLFVYDEDEGKYLMTGIVDGTGTLDGHSFAAFRIVNETAASEIREAMYYSGSSECLNYPAINTCVKTADGIKTSWSSSLTLDTGTRSTIGQTGWEISRNDGNGWKIVGNAGASDRSFTDTSAKAGIYHNYKVRAISVVSSAWTNTGPWSGYATPTSIGTHSEELASALNAPYLYITSGGNAPFVTGDDGRSIHSGKIMNNADSWTKVIVYGPGVLTFTWSADCEAADGDGPTDYASVSVTGDSAPKSTISGSVADTKVTVDISASGPAEVVINYHKNDFIKSGKDRVVVKDMNYFYSGSYASLPGGVQTSGNHFNSPLIGDYYDYTGLHWIYDTELGFIYVNEPASQNEWEASQSLWMYLNDNPDFGWCCAPMNLWPWLWSANMGWIYYMGGGWFWVQNDGKYEKL
jgi:V8-like Glu-specific endopeptidase